MKKNLIIISTILLLLSGCENEDETYTIELNDPYNVCGETIYFSNDAWGKELNMNTIIDTIKDACNNYEY